MDKKKGCTGAESYPSALQPAYVSFVPTHTPYCTSVYPIVVQVVQNLETRPPTRPDDPMDDGWMPATTGRARREDGRREESGDERRGEGETDHVGRVTVRVAVHAQGARDDETRRTSDG